MLLQLWNVSSVNHQDKQSKCCMMCDARCQTLLEASCAAAATATHTSSSCLNVVCDPSADTVWRVVDLTSSTHGQALPLSWRLSASSGSAMSTQYKTAYRRQTVNGLLKRLDLSQFFQAYVTAEDGMDTISQRFLSASIKLGRPPNQCVVFESSPAGITAAHNCTMKVRPYQYRQVHINTADIKIK